MPEEDVNEISITVKALDDLNRDELENWERIAGQSGADVYLTPNWISVWAKNKNKRTRILCLIARRGDEQVGYLPVAIAKIWCGPVPLRVARIAGADPNSIITHFPIYSNEFAYVLASSARTLLNHFNCDLVSLTPLSGDEESYSAINDTLVAQEGLSCEIENKGVHTVFQLPQNMNEYLEKRLSKKRRAEYRRNCARLLNEHKLTHAIEEAHQGNLEEFVALHARYWNGLGKGGHFSDWPEAQQFYQDLAERTAGTEMLLMSTLRSEAEMVAAELVVVGDASAFWRLPARREGPELDTLGIGKASLILMIGSLMEKGISRLEAGPGSYKYKIDAGGIEVSLMRIRILKDRSISQLKFRWCAAYSDLVDLLYYRAWFKKLRPILGDRRLVRHRPLWCHWRETRL